VTIFIKSTRNIKPKKIKAEALRFSLIPGEHLSLTDTDLTDLKDLRRRQLESLTDERTWQVALSLVDLLFAYSYDLRATGFAVNLNYK
jgi:hypothetical protein